MCVVGDLNARVGDHKVQGVIGDYGVSGVNESGKWTIDWCMQYEITKKIDAVQKGVGRLR